jgi:hypothetical protein
MGRKGQIVAEGDEISGSGSAVPPFWTAPEDPA